MSGEWSLPLQPVDCCLAAVTAGLHFGPGRLRIVGSRWSRGEASTAYSRREKRGLAQRGVVYAGS